MPEKPTRITRLALVLDELLTLAEVHERTEVVRYRRLAFSFLPFDTAVSRLMASLGIQCEMRVEELRRLSRQLGLPEPPGVQPQPSTVSAPPFFITTQDVAFEVLTQAVTDAGYSLHFHEHLREASTVPALYPALTAVIKQKRAEHTVLEGFLASRSEVPQMEEMEQQQRA
ncbi:hypothetical protein ACUY1T_05605 [Billgrantia sp. Q4P2]|uniref:hypothetical protein n=1 Tax=Billgrantia sp. Q4P2 TaxID=3463857 RepID=UPI004055A358